MRLTAEQLRSYAGVYWIADRSDRRLVELRDGQLVLTGSGERRFLPAGSDGSPRQPPARSSQPEEVRV